MSRRCRAPSQVAWLIGASVLAAMMVVAAVPAASQAAKGAAAKGAAAKGAAAKGAAAKEAAEGRKHAERASHLAASGKCRQALGEYDKAIAVLRDPTLLFNRGECHRKLGNAESALEDYNQFLSDLPNAPNRAQVEARIAELRVNGSSGEPAATSAMPAGPGAAVPATRPEPRKPVADAAPVAPTPRLDVAPPPPTTEAAPRTVLAEPGPPGTSGSSAERADSLSHRPWFWVALGAVVVGAGIGTYFVLGRDPTNIPRSDLGNYRF